MKLGRRTGHLVLVAATLAFATPMVLMGVANGAQGWTATTTVTVDGGEARIPESVSKTSVPGDPQPATAVTPAPGGAGAAAQPVEPAPATAEPATPPVLEIPGLPLDPPASEDSEPAPEEPAP